MCIHGHFYQPPHENPWLNEVGLQESSSPYHDWNERIDDNSTLKADYWQAQNIAFRMQKTTYNTYLKHSEQGNKEATLWI